MNKKRFTKQIAALLMGGMILFTNSNVYAQTQPTSSISQSFIQENGLEVVEEVPEGITPIMVKDEVELENFIKQLDDDFAHPAIEEVEENTGKRVKRSNSDVSIHKQTIFKLSSLGGKIVSEVGYVLIDVPFSFDSIDYHDLYETGIYGLQEITYDTSVSKAKISRDRQSIDVRAKGQVQVYIGISGGGASGNFVLKTYRFDESYSIDESDVY